jgi:hypothetical protein
MNINVFQIYTINATYVSNNLNNHNLIYKNNKRFSNNKLIL